MTTLAKTHYILLGTRKRSGEFVDTPVWFANGGETLYAFSAGDAGKVKRLRNFSEARVAPCAMLGKPLGEFQPAEAFLLDSAEDCKAAHKALLKQYGWQMATLDFFAGLAGRKKTRRYIRISLAVDGQ